MILILLTIPLIHFLIHKIFQTEDILMCKFKVILFMIFFF